MNSCIYCKTRFVTADAEHILQNSFGAKWTSKVIVCNDCQSVFGRTIDSVVEKGFQPIRNLLGTKGGRGEKGPPLKNLADESGKTYHVQPGGIPVLAEPAIQVEQRPDGTFTANMELPDANSIGWGLAKLQAMHPGAILAIQEPLGQPVLQRHYLTQPIHMRMSLGGVEFFQGLAKAAFNLLAAKYPEEALKSCFDNVRKFVLNGTDDLSQFIRWPTSEYLEWYKPLGPADHVLFITSDDASVEAVIQLYGGFTWFIQLANAFDGKILPAGYQVNPLRNSNPKQTRTPCIFEQNVGQFKCGVAQHTEESRNTFTNAIVRLYGIYQKSAVEREIDNIFEDVLGPHTNDQPLTHKEAKEISRRVSEFIVSRIRFESDDGEQS